MAILIDEYGGVSGIVSIEDLIEEVMGNIDDEYDDSEAKLHKIDENTDYKYFPASVAAICYSTVGWSRSSCEPE